MAATRPRLDDFVQPLKRLKISSSGDRPSSSSEDTTFQEIIVPKDEQQLAEKVGS
jgi:hypothetical protein